MSDKRARRMYLECVRAMRIMYQDARLVHGDLSEYNLLLVFCRGRPVRTGELYWLTPPPFSAVCTRADWCLLTFHSLSSTPTPTHSSFCARTATTLLVGECAQTVIVLSSPPLLNPPPQTFSSERE